MTALLGRIGDSIVQFFEQVWAVILHFKPVDMLDILFVALMLYALFRLIRETRGVQLLKGLFLLLLAAGAAGLLRMEASWFIFDQAMRNAVVLLVVLFQPEIRNAFEKLGRSNVTSLHFLSKQNKAELEHKEIDSAVGQVCEAFRRFSVERTGALVVFERVTMLGEVIKTGTVLDAKITRELVSNLFFAKAPLHDGAAIVRRGRLEAAGCILPLAQKQEIESSLGTRHRAAVGMSEVSDAVVAVVSEETGLISLAHKGTLRRGVSPEELGEYLRGVLLQPESGKKRLRPRLRGKEQDK